MKRPYQYTIICDKTGNAEQTNIAPLLHHLQTWEPTADPKVRELRQTKTCYIDTRYKAKLRLYNYLTYTKQGKQVPQYKPFAGTDIGKSIPILNF
jgi:hypothetical protein